MSVDLKGSNYLVAVEYSPYKDDLLTSGEWDGKRRIQINKHTFDDTADGAWVVGSTLAIAKLPKNATLLKVTLTVGDLGDTQVEIGDGDESDEFGTLNTSSSGTTVSTMPLAKVTKDTDIILTCTEGTASDGEVLNSLVEYSV